MSQRVLLIRRAQRCVGGMGSWMMTSRGSVLGIRQAMFRVGVLMLIMMVFVMLRLGLTRLDEREIIFLRSLRLRGCDKPASYRIVGRPVCQESGFLGD
jgi:hypothetical protein